MALLALGAGLLFMWLSLEALTRGRSVRGRRLAVEALLGVDFLAISGLNLYAFARDNRYSPYGHVFLFARTVLNAAAVVLVVALLVPAKTKPDANKA